MQTDTGACGRAGIYDVEGNDGIEDGGAGRDSGSGDIEGNESAAGGGKTGGAPGDQKLTAAIGEVPGGDIVDGGILTGVERGGEGAEEGAVFESFGGNDL